MSVVIEFLAASLVLGFLCWSLLQIARSYWKLRGTRVVVCPETGEYAAVELATWRIAVRATFRQPPLELRDCSRWRDRPACAQACRGRIAAAPEECLVLTILSKWYRDKTCACCGGTIEPLGRWRHRPCILSNDMRILEWHAIPAETIPRILETHAPVCHTCLVAETHIS